MVFALAGCGLLDSPATTLTPRSDFGWTSHRIFLQILRWDTAIFLVVQALLLVAVFKFRERDPKAIPRQVRGSAILEIVWTLIPAVILTFIAFPTVAAIFRTQAAPPKDALRVKVIGHQWWWEFQYPDLGVVTANELHLPAGRPVSLEIASTDVIHSFWVPQLGGKRDVDSRQHDAHRAHGRRAGGVLRPVRRVLRRVARQHAPPRRRPRAGGLRRVGGEAEGACPDPARRIPGGRGPPGLPKRHVRRVPHDRGVSAGGIGPDLTHFGSRRTIAGGIFPNTPRTWRAGSGTRRR